MPITTFLNEAELKRFTYVEDADLNEIFQEVRKSHPQYLLEEKKFRVRKNIFSKTKVVVSYALYAELPWKGEVQMINFCPASEQDSTINTQVSKSYIITYFYGILNSSKKEKGSVLEEPSSKPTDLSRESSVARVSLSAADFTKLTAGEIIERKSYSGTTVQILLLDIGFDTMKKIVNENYQKFLKKINNHDDH